ncbi:hypothetical protein Tco_0139396, partial [Tanacetum coccineum]
MSSETKLTKDEDDESIDNTKYHGMIGSLLYLTASRPNIMFSVCLWDRFQEDPKSSHLEAIKRIFRYIKGTTHLGLCYILNGNGCRNHSLRRFRPLLMPGSLHYRRADPFMRDPTDLAHQNRLTTLPFAFGGLGVYSAGDVLNYAFLASRLPSAGLPTKLLRHTGIVSLGPIFDDALSVFNTSMETNLLSNPSIPLFSVSKPCSACSKVFARDIYGYHAVSCDGIISIKHRHNIVPDTLVDICYRSGISAGKEVDIELDGGRDKPLRLADMLLYSWDGGLDRKRTKYMAKCAAIGYGFLPFSFSSLGELEADMVTLLKRIRKFSMAQDIGACAAVHIFNRISFAIAKGAYRFASFAVVGLSFFASLRLLIRFKVQIVALVVTIVLFTKLAFGFVVSVLALTLLVRIVKCRRCCDTRAYSYDVVAIHGIHVPPRPDLCVMDGVNVESSGTIAIVESIVDEVTSQ